MAKDSRQPMPPRGWWRRFLDGIGALMHDRTKWTKQTLAESVKDGIRKKCTNGLGEFRELEVFVTAQGFFLAWLERFPKAEFVGHEYMVMNDLHNALPDCPVDESTAWVSIFHSLWFGDNFPGWAAPAWRFLIRNDPRNLRFAIQACHWVQYTSGASGWNSLRRMIKEILACDVASSVLRELNQEHLLDE